MFYEETCRCSAAGFFCVCPFANALLLELCQYVWYDGINSLTDWNNQSDSRLDRRDVSGVPKKKECEAIFMWFVFALLSAVFAALTSILAKVGIDGVNSNLATAIRTTIVLLMSWGMVFLTNTMGGLSDISRKSWTFLILSGLATGASWLCYYKALQMGNVSKVVPIDKLSVVITLILAFVFLHEQFTAKSLIGCILIGLGTLVMVL